MSDENQASDDASTSTSPRPSTAKLFLGGLSWDTTEEKLRDHFGKYGSIVEAVVMRDRQTGRPRGFGFVTFTSPAAADLVVEDIHVIDGRQIDAKKSVPQEMKPKARKVFVGGLSPETSEDQFREYFSQFGEVVEAQIMQDHMSGRSRGFGFVTFAEDASAENVFAAGTMHDLGGKKVEVKPATPKGSGSLARPSPAGSGGPGGVGRPGSGGGPGGAPGSGGRGSAMLPFGAGGGPAGGGLPMFGGQPPAPYGTGFGMYGFPPPGMMPGAGAFGMQYGGMHNPYLMMQHMGGFPPGAAAFGFPASPLAGPAFSPGGNGGGSGGGDGGRRGPLVPPPYAQQHPSSAQPQPVPLPPHQRPQRMMSRGSSRNGKDSASSLDHGGSADVAAAAAAPAPAQPPATSAAAAAVVQEQLGKMALRE